MFIFHITLAQDIVANVFSGYFNPTIKPLHPKLKVNSTFFNNPQNTLKKLFFISERRITFHQKLRANIATSFLRH